MKGIGPAGTLIFLCENFPFGEGIVLMPVS
ncbi:hypothetical protein PMI21_04859 [Pseudomonas sp. GM18]|nr:hypothetical protein PMI21_04859 [Pseudomonas sp. GM18]